MCEGLDEAEAEVSNVEPWIFVLSCLHLAYWCHRSDKVKFLGSTLMSEE